MEGIASRTNIHGYSAPRLSARCALHYQSLGGTAELA